MLKEDQGDSRELQETATNPNSRLSRTGIYVFCLIITSKNILVETTKCMPPKQLQYSTVRCMHMQNAMWKRQCDSPTKCQPYHDNLEN